MLPVAFSLATVVSERGSEYFDLANLQKNHYPAA